MAGVGNVDIRRKTNYLIVDSSMLFELIMIFRRENLSIMYQVMSLISK